jgi:hypothetical protein
MDCPNGAESGVASTARSFTNIGSSRLAFCGADKEASWRTVLSVFLLVRGGRGGGGGEGAVVDIAVSIVATSTAA